MFITDCLCCIVTQINIINSIKNYNVKITIMIIKQMKRELISDQKITVMRRCNCYFMFEVLDLAYHSVSYLFNIMIQLFSCLSEANQLIFNALHPQKYEPTQNKSTDEG